MRDSGLGALFRSTAGGESPQGAGDDAGRAPTYDGGFSQDPSKRQLIQPSRTFPAVIRIVGVGGAGTNAVNRMLEAGLEGVEFIAVNTDVQALQMCEADHKLRIGRELTKGLGGGSDPEIGKQAAQAAYDDLKALLKGSDMVFITAGEGGGTGTGASPVIAEIAKGVGALTIGVVSRPFAFEGNRRKAQAAEGVDALRKCADTVIVVPNDKLLEVADRSTSMVDALRLADDVLRQGVQGICDLVTVPGLINLDLADVRTIMTEAGTAHMGIGVANGEDRAKKAADQAINSSLLETSIDGARGILLNISGGADLSLFEVHEVAEVVNAAADPDVNIIFGAMVDEALGDTIRVTVVATGFDAAPRAARPPVPSESADDYLTGGEDPGTALASEKHRDEAEPERDQEEGDEGSGDDLDVPNFLRDLD